VNGKEKRYQIDVILKCPADISSGGNLISKLTKECGDEILTGNITDIDREGLVNITYS